MKTCLRLALLIGLIGAGGCSSKRPQFDQHFNQLQAQMTFDQVKGILGPPDLRELSGDVETWHYRQNEGRVVVFREGHLTSFGQEMKSALGSSSPSLPQAPAEIGETCKSDSDCKSRNCHFHICSGKDNCQVPEGKLCATDNDCCSHYCDFSICKKKR